MPFLAGALERFHPDRLVDVGRLAHGTALRLLAMARHDASARLVSRAIRLGLARAGQAETALGNRFYLQDELTLWQFFKPLTQVATQLPVFFFGRAVCFGLQVCIAFFHLRR